MSREGRVFQLGGVVVPVHESLGYDERFEEIGGNTTLRLGRGAAVKQSVWSRLHVTLSGDGWEPMGLDALDYTAPLELRCGLPQAVLGGLTVTLPAARRNDAGYLPFARAHTPAGPVATSISIAGNVATLGAVAGAFGYSVLYYPQLTVYASRPTRSGERRAGTFAWEIVCEEV